MPDIVIVEDDDEVRELLIAVLKTDKNTKLVGAFSDGKSAIKNIPLLQPDIVLMDIGLPDTTGIECIKILKSRLVTCEFMVFSVFGDEANVFNALEAGASAYLLKASKPSFILASIDELFRGGSPMSPEIARLLINRFFHTPPVKTDGADQLTAREYEILQQLSKGSLYKEIAENLNISINTLKVHCYNIYQKLHVTNKVEAINKVFRNS